MKRKIFYTIILFIFVVELTGCGKETKKTFDFNAAFTIECIAAEDENMTPKTKSVVTYSFDENQYSKGYTIVTTQKFNDKETYNQFKQAQQQAIKENTNEDVIYDLKYNDKKLTLDYTMTIKMDVKNATTEEEKDTLRASTILKNNKDYKATCKVNGIKESEIK